MGKEGGHLKSAMGTGPGVLMDCLNVNSSFLKISNWGGCFPNSPSAITTKNEGIVLGLG